MRSSDWSSDVCSSDLTRAHLYYNSVCIGFRVVVHEVKNAHQRAMQRGMNLAALVAGMQHDLAAKRADVGGGIEPRLRVFEGFGAPRHLALVDFGDAGVGVGDTLRRLGGPCEYGGPAC